MRVLIVHNHYRSTAPSGERSVVEQESALLRENGHDVALFERSSDEMDAWGRVRRAALPLDAWWGLSSRRPFRSVIKEFEPDIVHVHNVFPLISPSIVRACARAGVPVVATMHNYKLLCASGDFFREGQPCFSCAGGNPAAAVRHGCYHRSRLQTAAVTAGMGMHRSSWRDGVAAFIFISAAQRDLLHGLRLPPERTFVKHNFIPSGLSPAASRDPRVTYLGRMEEAKGTRLILRSWDTFRGDSPRSPLRLSMVGGGPLEAEVRQWAAGHDSVDFHGVVPRSDAMDLLARSRCSLVPSLWNETFGLVAVESMAVAVPPVASTRGALPELIDPGVTGVLIDPEDSSELVGVLGRVDSFPEVFCEMGRRGREAYLARFTPERNLAQLESIYDFAIRNPVLARPRLGPISFS